MDLALDLPDAIPCVVRALSGHDEIPERPPWRCGESHSVDAVVVGTEPNAKLIGVLHIVPDTELLEDGIRSRVVHGRCHIEVEVVVGDPDFGLKGALTVGEGAVLGEVGGGNAHTPSGLVQHTVNGGRDADSPGNGLLILEVEGHIRLAQSVKHRGSKAQPTEDME